jgi:hypothetical protein
LLLIPPPQLTVINATNLNTITSSSATTSTKTKIICTTTTTTTTAAAAAVISVLIFSYGTTAPSDPGTPPYIEDSRSHSDTTHGMTPLEE